MAPWQKRIPALMPRPRGFYGASMAAISEPPLGKSLSDILVERLGKQLPSGFPEILRFVDPPEGTVCGYALTLEDSRLELRQVNFWGTKGFALSPVGDPGAQPRSIVLGQRQLDGPFSLAFR